MEKNWEVVVTQSDTSKNKQSSDLPINRVVELILAGGRPKTQKVKPVGIRFERIVSFFKREIHFTFEFSLRITKKENN